jgi:hypothetical protein
MSVKLYKNEPSIINYKLYWMKKHVCIFLYSALDAKKVFFSRDFVSQGMQIY